MYSVLNSLLSYDCAHLVAVCSVTDYLLLLTNVINGLPWLNNFRELELFMEFILFIYSLKSGNKAHKK